VLRSALRRNRFCAFVHRQLRGVAPLDWRQGRLKLGDLFEAGRGLLRGGGAPALKVPVIEELKMEVLGQAFTTALRCTCGAQRNLLRLTERIAARDSRCLSCGAAMAATGFDLMEELRVCDLPGAWRRQAVRSLGLQRGDFIRFSSKHRVSVVELVDDGMGGRHA